jgi:signal transduction histidine kinase
MQPWILREIPARRWLSVLLAGVVCLAVWQVWLTVRLLEQDRNLESQRSHDRLGEIADLALAQLTGSLGDWDLGLHDLNSLPPSPSMQARFPMGAIFILVSEKGITTYPDRPLLFTPIVPIAQKELPEAFDPVDELELREQQYDRAMALLKPLVLGPATRAEALLRLARMEYKSNQADAALDTYKKLASEDAFALSGTPYALLALSARCRILKELGRQKEAQTEAVLLRSSLLQGRWPLSRETFEYHWANLGGFGLDAERPPQDQADFAVLVSGLFSRWQNARAQGTTSSSRQLQPDHSLLLWNATSDRISALLAPPDWLTSSIKLPANSGDIQWKLLSPSATKGAGFTVSRTLADSGIPGRLEFSSVQPGSGAASSRRTLLIGGAALMLMVILGAGYVVHRAINRELRVAQLQADFVAAVSHEFRAPLTTLRTITELLVQHRIPDELRRQQSYVFLDNETTRLHRLVEDLLDFGRMESGRKQYRTETHNAFQLVRAAIADFTQHAEANGFSVEANLESAGSAEMATVYVDEEAFRRALRNLLDNAMKYSPVCRTVWVNGAVQDYQVLISVRDQGMGIGQDEQQAIFQKFVRGDAAKRAGIKGTGIGLAMVQQIAEAMDGEIRLQSEVGVGSTFTLVLPLADG